MQLLPWHHTTTAGFVMRGWHTPVSGKPLLHFLHGNGFCTRTYEPLLALLAEHFDLWLCDLQGHGESDHGGPFLGWNRNAELAVEAFEAGRQRFADVPRFACGHSFGGVLTSLILAAHPGLFERAVLLDPVLFPLSLIQLRTSLSLLGVRRNPMAEGAKARRHHWPDRETAFGALHNRGIFRGWEEPAFRAHIDHALKDHHEHGVELKCRPSREAEVFETMPRRLWPALKRIRTPTLLVHGDKTYPFVRQSTQRLAAINPQVSTTSTPGGHCFMQEDSARSAALVRGFLLGG
ncbi:alpha/beta hydrolase [Halopseudomonas pelagia]|uniref:alpha/beta fold hydrolase n=1 Tax=Halopseudomonas pelagia TaxID=553151 RepID=UPI0030DC8DFA|tara:strand:+ start:4447 stop:5322 length:876 start_codon:yes stop_codon:yes gene_type:complete